jgi:predicted CoA-binding protein
MARETDRARMAAERERAAEVLDAEEARWRVPLLGDEERLELLASARRIAIVGASPDRTRPSNGVMRYLQYHGYECVPVNPTTREVLGLPTFPSLEEATAETGPFDIVDVFRRPEYTPPIARESGRRAAPEASRPRGRCFSGRA